MVFEKILLDYYSARVVFDNFVDGVESWRKGESVTFFHKGAFYKVREMVRGNAPSEIRLQYEEKVSRHIESDFGIFEGRFRQSLLDNNFRIMKESEVDGVVETFKDLSKYCSMKMEHSRLE